MIRRRLSNEEFLAEIRKPAPESGPLTTEQKADLIIALVGDRVLARCRQMRAEKEVIRNSNAGG